ncbi:hypothetical protein [Bacterioplanoides sp.]
MASGTHDENYELSDTDQLNKVLDWLNSLVVNDAAVKKAAQSS